MALSATVYHFQIELSDVDRGVYQSLDLRVARHPSESTPYLLTRVIAYALLFEEGIAFTKGLSTSEEPALWVKDLQGRGVLRVAGLVGSDDAASGVGGGQFRPVDRAVAQLDGIGNAESRAGGSPGGSLCRIAASARPARVGLRQDRKLDDRAIDRRRVSRHPARGRLSGLSRSHREAKAVRSARSREEHEHSFDREFCDDAGVVGQRLVLRASRFAILRRRQDRT